MDPDAPALDRVAAPRSATAITLTGPGTVICADRAIGRLTFAAPGGAARLREAPPTQPIAGVPIADFQAFTVDPRDALHGLGQFRDPVLDARGRTIVLQHATMDAVNPFLVSPGGWGIRVGYRHGVLSAIFDLYEDEGDGEGLSRRARCGRAVALER